MATQDGFHMDDDTEVKELDRPASPATDVASLMEEEDRFVVSTPVGEGRAAPPSTLSDLSPCVPDSSSSDTPTSELTRSLASTQTDMGDEEILQVPVLGYEVMEERARFTVFKIQVRKGNQDSWFLFRRYSDFVRLNYQLKGLFPHFRLSLPPKNWFGDNFNNEFLEDRLLGLQAFINNIIGHRDVCFCEPVRLFFCLDDPPGAHDSLEESRALCDEMESQVFSLKHDLREKDEKIALLEDEVALHKVEIENLKRSLGIERSMNRRCSPSSQPSECSLPEHEQPDTEAGEAPVDDKEAAPSTSKIAALVDCNAKKMSKLKVECSEQEPASSNDDSDDANATDLDGEARITVVCTEAGNHKESQNSSTRISKHKELQKEYFTIPEALSE